MGLIELALQDALDHLLGPFQQPDDITRSESCRRPDLFAVNV